MSLLEIIFLAIGLAMDCFTVSIVCGVLLKRPNWPVILRMSLLFGFFQAFMPLIGWMCTTHFAQYIEAYDHWVAFALLAFLGVRMILSAFKPEEAHHTDPTLLSTQVTLAIATSIDALAVGISFACTGFRTLSQMTLPLLVIGIVSFLFGVLGNLLGLRFGSAITRRLRPELIGGLILIFIGAKILVTHLCE